MRNEFGAFSKYLWDFVDEKPIQNNFTSMSEMRVTTPLSDKISTDLKSRGFIVYAHLQAMCMVNDHTADCFRHKEVS